MGGSSSKSRSYSNQYQAPASVWGGQAPYLQNLYSQGAQAQQNAQGMNTQLLNQAQSMMTPQGYGQMAQQAAAPLLQNLQSGSIQAMNLGGSRQGVAQAQVGNQIAADYMNALPQIYNMGLAGSGFGSLSQLRNIIGAPTVLSGGGHGGAKSRSDAMSFSMFG